jgi:hypothetical protein
MEMRRRVLIGSYFGTQPSVDESNKVFNDISAFANAVEKALKFLF